MTIQNNNYTPKSKIIMIDPSLNGYHNHPYFVKKVEKAIESLRNCPPPDENQIAQMVKEAKEKQASKVNPALEKYKEIAMFEDKMAICAEPIAKYSLPHDSNNEVTQQKVTDNELQTKPIASKPTKIKRKYTKKTTQTAKI
jgi:hypothetical protein